MVLNAEQAVARILVETASLAEATPRLLAAIAEALGWDLGGFWEPDASGSTLHRVAHWHRPGLAVDDFERRSDRLRLPLGLGLPGRVWAAGQPSWSADVLVDPNFMRAAAARASGVRSGFAFPVRGNDGVLGVLEFFALETREPDPPLLEASAALGRQIGQYVEHRRAEEAVAQSEARKTAMLAAALDCIVTIDHHGRVVEFNPAAEQTFGYATAEAVGREMAELIIPPTFREAHRKGLAHYLATGVGPVLERRIELTGMRADGSEFPVELTITATAVPDAPLFTAFLRDITERRRAEEERTQLLEREHAARLRAEEAERDARAVALTLQRSLLPPHLPTLPGIELAARYRPTGAGNEVGGDFYDLFETGAGGWAVVIGDVSGKGPPAAGTTALARYTLRAAAMRDRRPSRVLAVLNDALLRQGEADELCTVAYGLLEPQDGGLRLTVANAGHPSPQLLHADGRIEAVGETGTALGALPEPRFVDRTVELEPGDTLLLHTDGLLEAHAPEVFLGTPDVQDALRAARGLGVEAVAERMENSALRVRDEEPRDDLAILVLRIGEGVAEGWGGEPPLRRSVTLAGGERAPGAAREALAAWESRLSPDAYATARLLVSELVTNSVLHSGAGPDDVIELELSLAAESLRVEVSDRGEGFTPPDGVPGLERESGRGLFLVESMAGRFGIEDEGRCVWFELERSPAPVGSPA